MLLIEHVERRVCARVCTFPGIQVHLDPTNLWRALGCTPYSLPLTSNTL